MVNVKKGDPQRRVADVLRKASRLGGALGAVAVVQARERMEAAAPDFLEPVKKRRKRRRCKPCLPKRIPASRSARWVVRVFRHMEPGRAYALPELFRPAIVPGKHTTYFFTEMLFLVRAGLLARQSAPEQRTWAQHGFWLTQEGAEWRKVVLAEKLWLCFGPGWSARAISEAVKGRTPADYSLARGELVKRWHGFHKRGGDLGGKHSGRTGSPVRPTRKAKSGEERDRDDGHESEPQEGSQ